MQKTTDQKLRLNEIYIGHVLDILKQFPSEVFDTVITSPPYWGLRDYGIEPIIWDADETCEHEWVESTRPGMSGGPSKKQESNKGSWHDPHAHAFCSKCNAWKGCLGLEPTPELYVKHIVEIFQEVKRVLRKDGTCWVNLGDSYSATRWSDTPSTTGISRKCSDVVSDRITNLPPKNLCGIPWRVAFALQADGWYLRSDIIWSKPNPMPESVTDRPTKAHEYIFLFTKSSHYYFDQEAVREAPLNTAGVSNEQCLGSWASKYGSTTSPGGRNIRSVWTIATQPYKEAHFATFPEKLLEPMIKAGTSEKGCCPECGKPWERVIDRKSVKTRPGIECKEGVDDVYGSHKKFRSVSQTKTLHWQPTCSCNAEAGKDLDPIPSVVFDPFIGSGTTAKVAIRLRRNYVGVDINPKYKVFSDKRTDTVQQEFF